LTIGARLVEDDHDVFLQYGVERNSYPYDYTVVPYIDGNRSTSWLENQYNHNLVMTYCRNGGQDSDSDTPCGAQATSNNTPIRGYHSLGEIRGGWIVCASGSASHTDNRRRDSALYGRVRWLLCRW
jgi:streptogrisin C